MNLETMRLLVAKGLSAEDLIQVEEAMGTNKRSANAERQARFRARKNAPVDVTSDVTNNATDNALPTPPNEESILTPREASEAEASSPHPRPWALPAGVSFQVWSDFLSNRKRKRLGTTPTAWKSFLDDLGRVSSQTGIPPPDLIRQCTAKGWGAIYDPRDQRNDQRSVSGTRTGDGLSPTTRAAAAVFGLEPRH